MWPGKYLKVGTATKDHGKGRGELTNYTTIKCIHAVDLPDNMVNANTENFLLKFKLQISNVWPYFTCSHQ